MNARLRIAVLGTARIARSVIPHIQASAGAEVVAIASRSLAKAQQFAAELNVPRAFGSYEETLKSSLSSVSSTRKATFDCSSR